MPTHLGETNQSNRNPQYVSYHPESPAQNVEPFLYWMSMNQETPQSFYVKISQSIREITEESRDYENAESIQARLYPLFTLQRILEDMIKFEKASKKARKNNKNS